MKIVIAGAGEVGAHLARMLSHEEQDIILMDIDPERLSLVSYSSDILTFRGSPTSISDLKAVGIEDADLFVGVTPEESINVTACMLASRLGAKKTIARINNQEYFDDEHLAYFEGLGVDSMIYPELLAAREIAFSIRNPWTRQYIDLFDGALALVGVKLREGAPLVGKQLKELAATEKQFHIVAIKRDLETIIPRGNDFIQHNDIVFFTCDKSNLETVRQLSGKKLPDLRKIVILGGSRTAVLTTKELSSKLNISIIEIDRECSMEISSMVPSNVQVFNGDGRDPELLREVGLEDADVFISLADKSETNVLACLSAKRYGVFKTIAKVENIDYIALAERLDIGTLVNKKLIAAGYIYRMLLGEDTASVKCLTIAQADVAELVARRGSWITKKKVKDLSLPPGITLGGMVRSGVPLMIEGETIIQPYDHVVVFCFDTPMSKLIELFN